MMKNFSIFLFSVLILFTGIVNAQTTKEVSKVKSQESSLRNAFDKNDENKEAATYLEIGDRYFGENNFSKSEEYYLKAKNLYHKIGDEENIASAARKLAQSQEKQKKTQAAAKNYETASEVSNSAYNTQINSNDASRLRSVSLQEKEKAIQRNIQMNSSKKKSVELSQDYENMAEIKVQQNNIPEATKNLNNAYELSKNKQPEKALEINQKAVDLLVEEKKFDKAIQLKKEVLKEDFVEQNSQEKVNQIQELAEIYLQNNDRGKAIQLLENSYRIALSENHTLQAQQSLMKLDSLYQQQGTSEKSISLYKDFLSKLPSIIENDSTLIDEKIIKETEVRIQQLEKEKQLQNQLIKKKNLFNYLLIGGLFLALGFIIFALLTQKKLKSQNKKIALQSLRREMNPHFIFNSLNSVNQFIAENNELEANQYLTKFSKLMRGVMENSKDDFISLNEELDLLKNYLALEKSRFQDKFDYEILVDEHLSEQTKIPGMLIQPFLENAIWHGLRYKAEKGFLKLSFKKLNKNLEIKIEDNGIGISKSEAQKTVHQKQRNGRGMKNTKERIQLLNDLYQKNIQLLVKEKDSENGVEVVLKMKV